MENKDEFYKFLLFIGLVKSFSSFYSHVIYKVLSECLMFNVNNVENSERFEIKGGNSMLPMKIHNYLIKKYGRLGNKQLRLMKNSKVFKVIEKKGKIRVFFSQKSLEKNLGKLNYNVCQGSINLLQGTAPSSSSSKSKLK